MILFTKVKLVNQANTGERKIGFHERKNILLQSSYKFFVNTVISISNGFTENTMSHLTGVVKPRKRRTILGYS